jgi:hypothetical protein
MANFSPPARKIRKLAIVSLPLFTFTSYTAHRHSVFLERLAILRPVCRLHGNKHRTVQALLFVSILLAFSFIFFCFVLVRASCRTKFVVRFLDLCSYFPWEFLKVFYSHFAFNKGEKDTKIIINKKNK